MVFSSIVFLFRFLPLFLLCYYGSPRRMKNFLLFMGSLIFYAWGEPVYVVLMLVSTLADYGLGRMIERAQEKGKHGWAKGFLLSSLAVNLLLLGFFKYADFLLQTVSGLTGQSIPAPGLPLPVGISFYTFQTMSYSIDVYRKKVPAQKNLIAFAAFVTMFPQLIAGPVVQYKTVAKELRERQVNGEDLSCGVRRFVIGLGKKVLLANPAGLLWETVAGWPAETLGMAEAWIGIFFFAFQIYYDFSGYSDMAIGLGRMLGFSFPENFQYPYLARSATEFWRRWNISLGSWFREYVYIPLGGSRRGKRRQLRNLFLVWTLTGVWHGASWNFLFWGMWFAFFLILEKSFLLGLLERWPTALQHLYTMGVVLGGWMLFALPEADDFFRFFKASLGFGPGGLRHQELWYLCSSNAFWLVLMLIGLTPMPAQAGRYLARRLEQKGRLLQTAGRAAETLWLMSLLLISLAFLVDASYNPFLYFRF